VLVSVGLWIVFDFLTVFSGMAARVLLPGLDDPMAAFPALASHVLSPWAAAVFMVGLFATIMSTLDSYLFIAATTIGHDLAPRETDPERVRRRTRIGLVVSAAAAAAGAMLFSSAVQVWHHVGSVVTAALLLPVLAVNLPKPWRPTGWAATAAMLSAAATAVVWIACSGPAGYPFQIEPLFPALAVAMACLFGERAVRNVATD
jgi:SSS family solute:Na+ symporter